MKIVSTGRTISTFEYLAKKQKARRKRLTLILMLALVLIAGLVALSRLKSLRLAAVSVSGAEVIGAESVESAVREALSGHYLYLVPRDNALLYPRREIESGLLSRFPRFSSATLSLEGLERLMVNVVEREPFALYCSGEEACWFLDKEGFIFDQAPSFSEGVYLVYAEEPPRENPLATAFLPAPEFEELRAFLSALPPLGLKPLSLKAVGGDFLLSLEGGARLWWGRESDFARTLANLEAFLKSPEILAEKDFLEKISELDLRTEDKVFWKVK